MIPIQGVPNGARPGQTGAHPWTVRPFFFLLPSTYHFLGVFHFPLPGRFPSAASSTCDPTESSRLSLGHLATTREKYAWIRPPRAASRRVAGKARPSRTCSIGIREDGPGGRRGACPAKRPREAGSAPFGRPSKHRSFLIDQAWPRIWTRAPAARDAHRQGVRSRRRRARAVGCSRDGLVPPWRRREDGSSPPASAPVHTAATNGRAYSRRRGVGPLKSACDAIAPGRTTAAGGQPVNRRPSWREEHGAVGRGRHRPDSAGPSPARGPRRPK